jgi:hypothetical protein
MTYPVFASGDVLNASDMNAVGMWLVKTQTVGSAVSSVTVTGAFSADYDNYFVTYTGGTASTTMNLSLRLGATTTGYYGNLVYSVSNNPAYFGLNVSNGASWLYVGDGTSTGGARMAVTLFNPFQTVRTGVTLGYMGTGAAGAPFGTFSGNLDDATSYTAFTIGMNTGTITGGTIRVYGYRN